MTGETKSKLPTRILIVGDGGVTSLAREVARKIAAEKYEMQIISPRDAKLQGLKPHDDIVELANIIPKTMQYYPKEQFEPNRRTRRKKERKNKHKR